MPLASIARKAPTSSGSTLLSTLREDCASLNRGASVNVTTSAPPPFKKARRETCVSSIGTMGSGHLFGRTHHGLDDAHMGAALAEVARERLSHLIFRRLLGRRQERRSLHDHAIDAVPALRSLLVDEYLLQRMWLLGCAQSFERDDLGAGNR